MKVIAELMREVFDVVLGDALEVLVYPALQLTFFKIVSHFLNLL